MNLTDLKPNPPRNSSILPRRWAWKHGALAQTGHHFRDPETPRQRAEKISPATAYWRSCRTVSVSCAPPTAHTWRARTISTFLPARSAASTCARATPFRARSAHPTASAISLCSRSARSTSPGRKTSSTRSCLKPHPLFPDQRLTLETGNGSTKDLTGRIIDLVAPIGKGCARPAGGAPKAGKTIMMQNIAQAIITNNPVLHHRVADRRTAGRSD